MLPIVLIVPARYVIPIVSTFDEAKRYLLEVRSTIRTVYLSPPSASWTAALKEDFNSCDILVADPASPFCAPPGRLAILRHGKVPEWSFVGSLLWQHAPHVFLAAIAHLAPLLEPAASVLLPFADDSPLHLQTTRLALGLLDPQKVVIPTGLNVHTLALNLPLEEANPEEALPAQVSKSMRRATWVAHLQKCSLHRFPLATMQLDGARLFAGTSLAPERLGFIGEHQVLSATLMGKTLQVISAHPIPDGRVNRAMQLAGAHHAYLVNPADYLHTIVACTDANGRDFGLGFIRFLDVERKEIEIQANIVAGTPVPLLKLGSLRIDTEGRELPPAAPGRWAL